MAHRGNGAAAVLEAARTIHNLAQRIGRRDAHGEIPPAVQRQRWSALNVPLMWAAAGGNAGGPVLAWLASAADSVAAQVPYEGTEYAGRHLAEIGWAAMRDSMHERDIQSREDLAGWLQREGFSRPRMGQHIAADAQEHILQMAVSHDSRAGMLEQVYVAVTLGFAQLVEPVTSSNGQAPPCGGRGRPTIGRRGPRVRPDTPDPFPRARSQNTLERPRGSWPQRAPPPESPPATAWEWLDSVDLCEEWRAHVPTFVSVPFCLRAPLRRAFRLSLSRLETAKIEALDPNDPNVVRAWKLFFLIPRLLLHRSAGGGKSSRANLNERVRAFDRGDWEALLQQGLAGATEKVPISSRDAEASARFRADKACRQVRAGEASHARQTLTASNLAPGDGETLRQLSDPVARPPVLSVPIPEEVLGFQPAAPIELDMKLFLQTLRSTRRGVSGGPAGMRNEHLKVLLPDAEALAMLGCAAHLLANARVPLDVSRPLALGRMVALQKSGAQRRVRGIVVGDTFRRVVAKSLAKQYAEDFAAVCAPLQFGVATKAGSDCIVHLLRAETDGDEHRVIISLDGVGAYDHARRAAMLGKLRLLPKASALLPFVSLFYGQASTYLWTDAEGRVHDIRQGEGCEQGDALSPALFCLGLQGALDAARAEMLPNELLVAYLDDVYAVTTRDRAREVFDIIAHHVLERVGVRTHLGKTQCWCKGGGPAPEGILELNAPNEDPVWRGDLEPSKNGVVVLGAPLGGPEFVDAHCAKRVQEERRFLDVLPTLPDLQCAWLLLYFCAVPRANYLLRNLPPAASLGYAHEHDDAIWGTLLVLLGVAAHGVAEASRLVAQLPCRLGGMGLRSAVRTAPAAFWSAWADVLPILCSRFPASVGHFAEEIDERVDARECFQSLRQAGGLLQQDGCPTPTFREIAAGARPPPPEQGETDPGEWQHGWQYFSSDAREKAFRAFTCFPCLDISAQTMLRSQSGRQGARAFTAVPWDASVTIAADRFRVMMCRRLRLPIVLAEHVCEGCGDALDAFGDHYAACMRTGRVQARARPAERAWERVLKEAGATTYFQKLLRETTLPVDPTDARRIDILATGLPAYYGRPLFCDATVRSPLTAAGLPHGRAALDDGFVLRTAMADKRRQYGDVFRSRSAELVVLACEVGGRWNEEALSLINTLARNKVANTTPLLRTAAQSAWANRWWSMLAVAVQDSLAASLLAPAGRRLVLDTPAAELPHLDEVLDGQRWAC